VLISTVNPGLTVFWALETGFMGLLLKGLQIEFILIVTFLLLHALVTLFLVLGKSLRFELSFAPITEEWR
jgi:hypothetical protein